MKPYYLLPLLVAICDAARVLVYSPTISPSHMKINSAVADALVTAGHNVVSCFCILKLQYPLLNPNLTSFTDSDRCSLHGRSSDRQFCSSSSAPHFSFARRLCQSTITQGRYGFCYELRIQSAYLL